MPRVHRRSKRRTDGYNEREIEHLLEGQSLWGIVMKDDRFHNYVPGWRNHNYDLAREAWAALGENLTAEWIQRRPGSRPWGWWAFTASPNRRERIDGERHHFDDPAFQSRVAVTAIDNPALAEAMQELNFGVPRLAHQPPKGEAYVAPRYEGELSFLDRHGLLTPYERSELYGEESPESESNNAQSEA